jgi:hypothetical protein
VQAVRIDDSERCRRELLDSRMNRSRCGYVAQREKRVELRKIDVVRGAQDGRDGREAGSEVEDAALVGVVEGLLADAVASQQ